MNIGMKESSSPNDDVLLQGKFKHSKSYNLMDSYCNLNYVS